MILPNLAEEDQVCFSLSCKYFYNCLLSFLRVEKLQLAQPHLLPRDTYPILFPHINKEPRIDLLHRLQNENWGYCHYCRALHSKQRFIDPQSGCCSSCRGLWGSPCFCDGPCMPYAGVVELCPCLTISFCDKLQILRDTIEQQGYKFDFGPYVCRKRESSTTLRHICSINHPTIDTHLHTSIVPESQQSRQHLLIFAKYEFNFSHEEALPSFGAGLLYSQKDIKEWLKKVFTEAGSSFSGWCCRESGVPVTSLPDVEVKVSIKKKHTLTVFFKRNLGSVDWPDERWTHHRLN